MMSHTEEPKLSAERCAKMVAVRLLFFPRWLQRSR